MKHFLLSPDSSGRIDPTIQKTLLDHIPGRVDSMAAADCVVVPISYMADYVFNDALRELNKPLVLFDFVEYGWQAGDKENRFGYPRLDLTKFSHLNTLEWDKLDYWLDCHPPALTFKRELFQRDVTERMLPVEFPCRLPIPPIQTEAEFNARPLEVFHNWGLSSPSRPRLHGDIFRNAHECNIYVIDGWDQRPDDARGNWMTVHQPHYNRKHIDVVMTWNQKAKLSVSLPGAGIKCFRSTEAPVGSIMALQYDEIAWSYPWDDETNCIRLEVDNEFDSLAFATHYPLYPIYVESQRTIAKYCSEAYTRDYVTPHIERVL